jgi:osmotically-inducible protein OsmY
MKLARPLFAAALLVSVLPACAPLVIGAIAAGTAIVATDRRTTGAQIDDQSIELRLSNELGTAFKANSSDFHISINSFERKVLLTGEVPTEQAKAQAGEIAARSLNVRTVVTSSW